MNLDKEFKFEESLYNLYIDMRKKKLDYNDYLYESVDTYIRSENFKAGFYVGVKIMLAVSIKKDD